MERINFTSVKNTIMNTTKQEVLVSTSELETLFNETINSPFVSITSLTPFRNDVKKSKDDGTINPYYRQIMKLTKRNYKVVKDYHQRVITQLMKEGKDPSTFELKPLSGKKHLTDCILTDTETETKRYVMVEYFDEVKGKSEYFHNNDPIGMEMFEKWVVFYEKKSNHQGLDRNVHPITLDLENILEVSMNGKVYKVRK